MGDDGRERDNYYDGGWLRNWRDFWSGRSMRPHLPGNITCAFEPESQLAK